MTLFFMTALIKTCSKFGKITWRKLWHDILVNCWHPWICSFFCVSYFLNLINNLFRYIGFSCQTCVIIVKIFVIFIRLIDGSQIRCRLYRVINRNYSHTFITRRRSPSSVVTTHCAPILPAAISSTICSSFGQVRLEYLYTVFISSPMN